MVVMGCSHQLVLAALLLMSGRSTAETEAETTTAGTETVSTTGPPEVIAPGPPEGPTFFPPGPEPILLDFSSGLYENISLDMPFMYAGQLHDELYLNREGFLTFFDDAYLGPPNQDLGIDIVAPFWSHFESNGRTTYSQETNGPLLDLATEAINEAIAQANFNASFVFVATWDKVPFRFFSGNASFQVVLTSDDQDHSFILLNYGLISSIPNSYWLAGLGIRNSDFLSIESYSPVNLHELSNVNVSGRWIFEVSQGPDAPDVPENFYPIFHGREFNPLISNRSTEEVFLSQAMRFFRHQENTVYVNWNGVLSFSMLDDDMPNKNISANFIAPLWSEFDNDVNSKVVYEEVTNGHRLFRATQDIKVMMQEDVFESSRKATHLFIATWINMLFENTTDSAIFQVVLVSTDDMRTFAILNYGNISTTDEEWLAGYSTADGSDSFFIEEQDTANLSLSSNVEIPGRWIFEVDGGPPVPCEAFPCAEDEVCVMRNGQYGCACADFNEKPNPDKFDATETCAGSSGSLSLSYCQIFDAGYNPESLHLYDPFCRGMKENNRLVFHFDSHENLCGTTLMHNGTHFTYNNAVGTNDHPLGLISRTGGLNIAFACVYPLIQSISMPMAIQATGSVVSKELSTEGTYTIRMIPYEDSGFQVPFSGNVTLEVNQQVYVSVTVDEFDQEQIATVLDSCWATPVNDSNAFPRWDLIVSECPNPADGTVEIQQNGASTSSFFSFRMFSFTGSSNNIFLHCEVHLCLLDSGNCAMPCSGNEARRRRRSVDFHDSASISMGF